MDLNKEDVERLNKSFDTLCAIRDVVGKQKYGELTFKDNDIVRMMAEELADTANYCRYQFIKLMKLSEELERQYPSGQSHNGTKVGWDEIPTEER